MSGLDPQGKLATAMVTLLLLARTARSASQQLLPCPDIQTACTANRTRVGDQRSGDTRLPNGTS
jgi:hypothetical protein